MFEKLSPTKRLSAGWSLEKGYSDFSSADVYPHRARLPGSSYSLEIYILSFNNEIEYLCSSFVKGFKVA